MKNTILGVTLAIFLSFSLQAQQIDQERMERDLKIAENILGTISNNSDRSIWSISRSIESAYIPEYGVIFSLPQNTLYYTKSSRGTVQIVAPSSGDGTSYSYAISSDDEEKAKKEQLEQNDLIEEINQKLEEHMTVFLVDYADLIGQLKPTDKIMINVKPSRNQVWVSGSDIRSKQSQGKTAEIAKSALIAYKQGKATREETVKKINFSDSGDKELARDLELFSSIFARLYEPDLSTTYYTSSRNINYERLDGLGAIYSMRVYSSSSNDGLHTIRTTGESGLTQEQRNDKVNAMYPEFEKSIKENLIDYGRTIKSLKPSEMLMLKVRLTECKSCEMPKSIEVSVKSSVLADFDSGKLSRDNAVKAVNIKKTSN